MALLVLTIEIFVVETTGASNTHSSIPWLSIISQTPVPPLHCALNLGEFSTLDHNYWVKDSHMSQFVEKRWKKVSDVDNFLAFQRKLLQTSFSLSLIQNEKRVTLGVVSYFRGTQGQPAFHHSSLLTKLQFYSEQECILLKVSTSPGSIFQGWPCDHLILERQD